MSIANAARFLSAKRDPIQGQIFDSFPLNQEVKKRNLIQDFETVQWIDTYFPTVTMDSNK